MSPLGTHSFCRARNGTFSPQNLVTLWSKKATTMCERHLAAKVWGRTFFSGFSYLWNGCSCVILLKVIHKSWQTCGVSLSLQWQNEQICHAEVSFVINVLCERNAWNSHKPWIWTPFIFRAHIWEGLVILFSCKWASSEQLYLVHLYQQLHWQYLYITLSCFALSAPMTVIRVWLSNKSNFPNSPCPWKLPVAWDNVIIYWISPLAFERCVLGWNLSARHTYFTDENRDTFVTSQFSYQDSVSDSLACIMGLLCRLYPSRIHLLYSGLIC